MQPSQPTDPAIAARDEAFIGFIRDCEAHLLASDDPIVVRDLVAARTKELVSGHGAWTMPDADFLRLQPGAPYSSYQLYLNEAETLSVVIDVFAPGQVAPVHNHHCWGVFACIGGCELERQYAVPADLSRAPEEVRAFRNNPGDVSVADPARNAFHQVECVGDVPTASIHIYGANIKKLVRERWDAAAGKFVSFQSGGDPRRVQARHYLTPEGLRSTVAA